MRDADGFFQAVGESNDGLYDDISEMEVLDNYEEKTNANEDNMLLNKIV